MCCNIKKELGAENNRFNGYNLNTVWYDRYRGIWYFVKGNQLFERVLGGNMKGPVDFYKESEFYKTLTPDFENL